MKTRMFHDLEAGGRNWQKELTSVLWALCTNVNRATRDTPFNLVYGAEAVLPPEIYLESARVAHFNAEDQAEANELDSNLLEERCNTALANVRKYQASMKRYYNKSVVVTPTFCKNKIFCANRSAYPIVVHMKNFPKINLA
jgi:hypothetical protein